MKRNRSRAVATTFLAAAGFAALLFAVPAPLWTLAEGVTWPTDNSQVRVGADGFIARLQVSGGEPVSKGQLLIVSEDPFLNARVRALEAQLRGLKIQLQAAQSADRVQAAIVREEISAVVGDLKRARERSEALILHSPRDGVFVVPNEKDLPGRFVRKGQLLAYVTDPADDLTARVIVSQDDIGLVRERTRAVEVMPAEWGAAAVSAKIRREVPGGTDRLPTAALGTLGGGKFGVDPRDSEGQKTLERVFEFEIGLPPEARRGYLGQRVFVKFDLGYEPLGFQMYRSLRQLFLRLFSV